MRNESSGPHIHCLIINPARLPDLWRHVSGRAGESNHVLREMLLRAFHIGDLGDWFPVDPLDENILRFYVEMDEVTGMRKVQSTDNSMKDNKILATVERLP